MKILVVVRSSRTKQEIYRYDVTNIDEVEWTLKTYDCSRFIEQTNVNDNEFSKCYKFLCANRKFLIEIYV